MNVSAVIVTRGDVPLDEILASLAQVAAIDDVVVWDNSKRENLKTWGRHAALAECRNRVIYSQDDDLVHTPDAIRRIIAAHEPGRIVGCMWAEWSAGAAAQRIPGGYSDLVFPGSGSVYDRETPLLAAGRYLEHHPADDFFRLWCDAIIGVLAPTVQIDERFELLPAARQPGRMAMLPDAATLKREAIMRARAIRDHQPRPKRHSHDIYMDELTLRLAHNPA